MKRSTSWPRGLCFLRDPCSRYVTAPAGLCPNHHKGNAYLILLSRHINAKSPQTWSSGPLLRKPPRMYPTDMGSSPAPSARVWPFCHLLLSIHLPVSLFRHSDAQGKRLVLLNSDPQSLTWHPTTAQAQESGEKKRRESACGGNLSPRL